MSTSHAVSAASAAVATVTKTVSASASASASSSVKAAPQGGILEGGNPSIYDPKNPIFIFIIQAGIIIVFCRLLHWPLSKLRQPRVIAEVIGGVLLGPSVMGHVPGFTNAIFPSASLPNLNLVANLGLVLFLFLVGLEVDMRFMTSNLKVALSVGVASMILPFGLGCAIAYGIYNEFKHDPGTTPVAFGTYLLFVGVAMAITAFPVLCRILTELKLLDTPVGIIVLSAGVSNDITGWILLALCVALVNAGSGITALWVLLTAVAYTIFLFGAVRPSLMWILKRTHSLENGPSQSIVLLTLMICLTSAFFTGTIGIHPIFGAFMAGLICPHDGGFAIKVTEKIEDLVSTIFLPLYFAYSGLGTNLGLLDNGITWAYVIGIIACAFFGKIIAATLAARLSGLVWRESLAIGSLMSCKGLVELIVLNIGLQAKILSTRTFTMFVVMALVTTFATTPLVATLYPPWYQRKLEAWKRGEIDWDTGTPTDSARAASTASRNPFSELLIYLRLDNMSSTLAFLSLLSPQSSRTSTSTSTSSEPLLHPSKAAINKDDNRRLETPANPQEPLTRLHALRLLELTQRNSSVMRVAEAGELSSRDPVLNTFRTFAAMNEFAASADAVVIPAEAYAETLLARTGEGECDTLLLPWSETGGLGESSPVDLDRVATRERVSLRRAYGGFVAEALQKANSNVAVLLDNGFGGLAPPKERSGLHRTLSGLSVKSATRKNTEVQMAFKERSHHIFFPFCGGRDDAVALRMVLQLVRATKVTLTVVYYPHFATSESSSVETQNITVTGKSEKHTAKTVEHSAGSMTDANLLSHAQANLLLEAKERVVFETDTSSSADGSSFDSIVERARGEVGQNLRNAGDLVVLGRRWEEHVRSEIPGGIITTVAGERRSCLGDLADAMLEAGIRASFLVVQAPVLV